MCCRRSWRRRSTATTTSVFVDSSATYPNGERAELVPPPAGNFFGIFGGRLAVLNNGFSVAAVSALDVDIAQAILQQFFTGATGGERFIIDCSDEERALAGHRCRTAQCRGGGARRLARRLYARACNEPRRV